MQKIMINKSENPKYIQIRDHILKDIRAGRLQPGSKLPSREKLIEDYAVARVTLNKAIEDLTKAGVLKAVRKRGTFVANADARTETALICNLNDLVCCPEKPVLLGDTGRNVFSYILTHAPKHLRLSVIDSNKIKEPEELERYRKIIMFMPMEEQLELARNMRMTEVCVVNRFVQGLYCVTTDHRAAIRDVTNVFLDHLGTDCQIFFLDMTAFSQVIRNERREGFVEACEKHQIFYRIISGDGFSIINPLLELHLDPNKKTVIVSGSRYLTGAVFKLSIIRNLTFGKNLFYSDFDNFDTEVNYGEPIMSVVQNYSALGQAAINFLTSPLNEKKTDYIPHIIINKELYFPEGS